MFDYDTKDKEHLNTPRGRKCCTRYGVLMITCQGVLVITVGKLLYILQKHSSKMVIFIFEK
jgi:hypothetical protein